jgi:hypothetical protein
VIPSFAEATAAARRVSEARTNDYRRDARLLAACGLAGDEREFAFYLHECVHVAFANEAEARPLLGGAEERLVRYVTRALYAMGWRWRKTDRGIAQIERELNQTAAQRDELAREADGAGAPARDFDYPLAGDTERLRAALEKYGTHLTTCAQWDADVLAAVRGIDCTCGLDAALAEGGV